MDCNLTALLLPLALATLVSLGLTPLVRTFARRMGVLAYPDSIRRFHAQPVPLWGGAAVYLSMVAGLLVALRCAGPRHEELASLCRVLIPAAGVACLFGGIDDRYNLRSRAKLALQLVSTLIVVAAGYAVDFIVVFGYRLELGWLGVPLTILWLLGCINALNLIDGADGLACVVGLSTATMMGIIAVSMGNYHVAEVAIVLAGALAGFCLFNLPPASVFLGDSGSTLIGLVVGVMGMQGSMKSSATLSITAPAVIMILPLFDVVMAVVRRKLSGRPLAMGDRAHIHHRLMERGLGPWQVLCVIAALCLTTGAAATAATMLRVDALAWIIATTLIVLMVHLRVFGHHEFVLVRHAIRHRLKSLLNRFTPSSSIQSVARDEDLGEPGQTADKTSSTAVTFPDEDERRQAA